MEAVVAEGENRSGNDLACPRCGSQTVDEFRQSVIRYRITPGHEQVGRVERESEDPIFHRCVDCGYGSDTNIWEQEGRSDFTPHREVCQ